MQFENVSVVQEAALRFTKEGENIQSILPYGNGHIGDTYLVETTKRKFILQKLNTDIFKDPDGLMRNILLVTKHLKKKIQNRCGDPSKETLTILKTCNDELLYKNNGNVFRAYHFIEGGVSFEQISVELFQEAGRTFSLFQKDLMDFDASLLTESIPDFHHTKKRYDAFLQAISEDSKKRLSACKDEVDFLLENKPLATALSDLQLPLRVTHNDTKLNNVLLNPKTKKGLAVIDLDTIMPGYLAIDFGDAIRTGANTAVENEKDLTKVSLSLPLYKAFLKGFLSEIKDKLTSKELKTIHLGALVITFEQALRFLTDYLCGDTYYKTSYAEENLIRTRVQITLLKDMIRKEKEMLYVNNLSD